MLENLNTQGSKGTNAQYQRAVIELLKGILSASGGGGGTYLTAGLARVTTSGSTVAGTKSVTFFNSGGANGTVAGTTLEPNEIVTFESDQGYNAIAYNATGTEFLISTSV